MVVTSNGKKVDVQRIVDAQKAKAIRIFLENGERVILNEKEYKPIFKFTEAELTKAVEAKLKKAD